MQLKELKIIKHTCNLSSRCRFWDDSVWFEMSLKLSKAEFYAQHVRMQESLTIKYVIRLVERTVWGGSLSKELIGVKLPPKKINTIEMTFQALAIHWLTQNLMHVMITPVLQISASSEFPNSFDTTFSCFLFPQTQHYSFFPNSKTH